MGISGQIQTETYRDGIKRNAVAMEGGRVDGKSYIVERATVTGDGVGGSATCKGSLDLAAGGLTLNVTLAGETECSTVLSGSFTRDAQAVAPAKTDSKKKLAALKGVMALEVLAWTGGCAAEKSTADANRKTVAEYLGIDPKAKLPVTGKAMLSFTPTSNVQGTVKAMRYFRNGYDFYVNQNATAGYTFTEVTEGGATWNVKNDDESAKGSTRVRLTDKGVEIADFNDCATVRLVTSDG